MEKLFLFLKRNSFTLIMIAVAFIIAGLLAFFLANQSVERLKSIAENRLAFEASLITSQAREKYSGGVTATHALGGFFAGSTEVERDEFHNFIETARFFDSYPEFSTFAYVERVFDEDKESFLGSVRTDSSMQEGGYPSFTITPEGTREEYWPITYVNPEKASFLLGQDQHAESARTENIARARDLGTESLSTPVKLGQGDIGVLIAVPLYEGGKIPSSLEEKRRLFKGAVTAAFLVDEFFGSFLPVENLKEEDVTITVSGRSGIVIPLFTAAEPNDLLTRFFGRLEKTQDIEFQPNKVEFVFAAPVRSLLSTNEAYEPILLTLTLFAGAAFMSIIIIISQKAKLIADLRKRYTFISTLSHQLRTPTTSLRWQFEGREVPEEETETQEQIMENILVLNSIIDRLLLYIEIADKKIVLDKKKILVETFCDGALHALSSQHDLSRIKRIGDIPTSLDLLVDNEKITLALLYVAENALTYSPKDTQVTIELKVRDGFLDIIVADKGYGIPKDEQKEIFSEFFRASNASLGINYGSGVSLYMAKKIIERHGGFIRFSSEEGKGSAFTVSLPTTT